MATLAETKNPTSPSLQKDGFFTWKWGSLPLMKKLSKDQTVTSDLFEIGGFKWRLILEIDEHGNSEHDPYKIFNVYLEIPFNSNKHITDQTVITNYRLYHHETGVSGSDVIEFGFFRPDPAKRSYADVTSPHISSRNNIGWSNMMLRFNELKQFRTTTIGCYINILRIKDIRLHHILYQCPLQIKRPFSRFTAGSRLGYKVDIEWKLSDEERTLMKNARCGQSFESQIHHEMFCFRIFPNGINPASRGQVILCVALCLLPPFTSRITARVLLKCIETGAECKAVGGNTSNKLRRPTNKLSYSYRSTFYHWPEYSKRTGHKPLFFEVFKQQKHITFIAELTVLKHYDLDGKEINDWRKCYPDEPAPKQPKSPQRPPMKSLETLQTVSALPLEIAWNITDVWNENWNKSTICTINGLEWFLRWKYDSTRATCTALLCLHRLPAHIKRIIVNYRLFCTETGLSHTDIVVFDERNWSHGIEVGDIEYRKCFWSKGMIPLRCYINVIKIINQHDAILYETPMKLFNEKKLKLYRYEWHIDDALLETFLQSNVLGQKYESNIFERRWCFTCFPNGFDENSKGKTMLRLQICMFPKHVTKIRVKIKLLCPSLNKIWSTLTDFGYSKTSRTWNVRTLSKFELNGLSHLVFVAEIVVVEQFIQNVNGQLIPCRPLFESNELNQYFRNVMHFENKHKNNTLQYGIQRQFERHLKIIHNDIPQGICPLIKEYYPCDIWIWDITDQHLLTQWVLTHNMDKYESDLFHISGLKWYLKLYPNGYNKKNEGYVQVFVTLASLPPHVQNVLAMIRLSCHQTQTKYTFFAEYSKKHKTWGWHRNFSVRELHSLFLLNQCNRLTFECELKILKITEVKSKELKGNSYQYSLPLVHIKEDILQNQWQYIWHIDTSLVEMFRKAENGKIFESDIFNDMFCLQIYPNGFTKQAVGNVQVFCQICSFPKGVSAILVKLELICMDNNAKWQHMVRFSVDDNNWGWTDGTITTNQLYDYDELHFQARIQFIELYDENGCEQPVKQMQWIEDAHHDEKSPREFDASHKELEAKTYKKVKAFISDILIQNDIIELITRYAMSPFEVVSFSSSNLSNLQCIGCIVNPLNPTFISDVFELYDLKWVMESDADECVKKTQYIFYRVKITLCSMPFEWSQIAISYRIYCEQSMSSTTSLCILTNKTNNAMSSGYLWMKSNRKQQIDAMLTFKYAINILRVMDDRQEIVYEYPLNGGAGEIEEQKYEFEWKITPKMIEKFRTCFKCQKFESEDIYYDLFCIGIAPNGLKDANGVILYLQLCCMPTGVASMRVQCQMECSGLLKIQTEISQENMTINNEKFSRIHYKICRTRELFKAMELCDTKQLTIHCKVTIIETHEAMTKLMSMRTARASQDMDDFS